MRLSEYELVVVIAALLGDSTHGRTAETAVLYANSLTEKAREHFPDLYARHVAEREAANGAA